MVDMKYFDFPEKLIITEKEKGSWWRLSFRKSQQSMKSLYYLLGLIFLLDMLDAAFTTYWISIAGTSVELNPWLRQLLEKDFHLLFLFKAITVIILGFVVSLFGKQAYEMIYKASCLVVLVFTMVNIFHLTYFFMRLAGGI